VASDTRLPSDRPQLVRISRQTLWHRDVHERRKAVAKHFNNASCSENEAGNELSFMGPRLATHAYQRLARPIHPHIPSANPPNLLEFLILFESLDDDRKSAREWASMVPSTRLT
jgi:hypothetical protein